MACLVSVERPNNGLPDTVNFCDVRRADPSEKALENKAGRNDGSEKCSHFQGVVVSKNIVAFFGANGNKDKYFF